jgi:DNA polymerase-3 subunit delta'
LSDEEIPEGDRLEGAPHPREQPLLVGHEEPEAALFQAWQGGRLPHAILIGGQEGIGKATLAYRIARFVLAHQQPGRAGASRDFMLAADHPVSRQVAAQSHPDLLVLRRLANPDSGKLYSEIRVGDVRKIVGFFGSTPALGGYRVCVVDSAEEMNREGANALLKLLEEPPAKSLFLIVSHVPGRIIPTIRSRCRQLRLKPLPVPDVARAVRLLAERIPDLALDRVDEAAAASDGSVRRALALLLGEGLDVRALSAELFARLPEVDPAKLHTLGERIQSDQSLALFAETVEDWLARHATEPRAPLPRLARYAEAWEKVRRAAVETDVYRLDRKPFVFQVFAMLAEATRR